MAVKLMKSQQVGDGESANQPHVFVFKAVILGAVSSQAPAWPGRFWMPWESSQVTPRLLPGLKKEWLVLAVLLQRGRL